MITKKRQKTFQRNKVIWQVVKTIYNPYPKLLSLKSTQSNEDKNDVNPWEADYKNTDGPVPAWYICKRDSPSQKAKEDGSRWCSHPFHLRLLEKLDMNQMKVYYSVFTRAVKKLSMVITLLLLTTIRYSLSCGKDEVFTPSTAV